MVAPSCVMVSDPLHAGTEVCSTRIQLPEKSGRVCAVARTPTRATDKPIATMNPRITRLPRDCGMTADAVARFIPRPGRRHRRDVYLNVDAAKCGRQIAISRQGRAI